MQIANRWNFADIPHMDTFIRAVLDIINGNLDNDNIADTHVLLTTAERAQLLAGVDYTAYKDKSGGTLKAGMPVCFISAGGVSLADGSDTAKEARGFCISTDGQTAYIRASGPVSEASIAGGVTIAFGETIWLDQTAGKVTNLRPTSTGLRQELGVATDNGTAAGGRVDINAIIRKPQRLL